MSTRYVCTGIPDGEWASAGCQLTWNRDWGGQCPVCRGNLKPAETLLTIKTILKEETVMTKTIPVIPNFVADAIENFRRCGESNAKIVHAATFEIGPFDCLSDRAVAIRSIPFDTLLAALVNGYERELTAEQRAHEKISETYAAERLSARHCGHTWLAREKTAYADGIKFTLDTLGVKITEVNA